MTYNLAINQQLSERLISRYRDSRYTKPISRHTSEAYQAIRKRLLDHYDNLILDSGCGVGESSLYLAAKNSEALVLGIDKSDFKLAKNSVYLRRREMTDQPENLLLVRADLVDLWRLLQQDRVKLKKHFLLYPTPWPKQSHLKRRWYAHPVFPSIVSLGGVLEVRSNLIWYLQGWQQALSLYFDCSPQIEAIDIHQAITPFERKYSLRGESIYMMQVDLRCQPSNELALELGSKATP